ncbi:MAG TPA: 30S ribosomal protein S6 [Candidatus Enteromonas pullicola]|uniref:Small ribosomal subunit protein bS6 n=1 Tax=Candidatus Alloenteromonas pullicola TaxID=2840784 RepID=A0A9D1S2W1_9FIRM|nr:30S ribosomal protein S6 [Candidatus Enteromonas pullicola]
MGNYEIMYILNAALDDAARAAEMDKVHGILTSHKGTIRNVNAWGLRDFAYPIKKQTKGYYVVLKVTADRDCLKEFDRLCKLDNQVIRFLITVDKD